MIGTDNGPAKAAPTAGIEAAVVEIQGEIAGESMAAETIKVPSPWGALKVAVVDDAMHPPRLDRLAEEEAAAVKQLLTQNEEVIAELKKQDCELEASADKRLGILAGTDAPLASVGLVGEVSADALRMIEEHRAFRRLLDSLKQEVSEVKVCDPFEKMPDLTGYNLVLLDYYLEGPAKSGDLAVEVAASIRTQHGRPEDQQIVLMSSLESVRDLRGNFRATTGLTGSAFAFVGKPDLNETWKVKAHLGMLDRARPYAPALTQYRAKLDETLIKASKDLLTLVDDLDIGDYAFLQSHALMKDGHPLGDYVFWLLSSQLMTLAFECDEMRERQWALDRLEFVGEPFAATVPSTVVANLLHSALVSRNIGRLGAHPRAKPGSKYVDFPLVQLGDVFLNVDRTKAIVVMSADCDLAFSPMADREPDAETPVMLVPGTPIKLKDATGDPDAKIDGILHREEVYRIVWEFAKYRSVPLGELEGWLTSKGYDVSNRDRLRPLFALKLQQEFGAHLLRVGPPIMPPMTTPAVGRVFVCSPDRDEVRQLGPTELMLTRFKGTTLLRVTPTVAGALKEACEELLARLNDKLNGAKKDKVNLTRQIDALTAQLARDDFWIDLLKGVELNSAGSMKSVGPLGFVLGSDWQNAGKPRVVLDIDEGSIRPGSADMSGDGQAQVDGNPEVGAVSSAA